MGKVVKILRQFIDYYQENKKTLFKEGCMAALCIGLYLCNEIFMKNKVRHWFFQGYFNDILAGVLLAVITDFLFDPWMREKMSVKVKLVITLSAGMYWEFVSPCYIKDAVGGIWDLAAYCIGGGIRVFIKNYNQAKETSHEEDMYEV